MFSCVCRSLPDIWAARVYFYIIPLVAEIVPVEFNYPSRSEEVEIS